VPLEGGAAVKLGDAVEVAPAVSPDGSQVAYEYLDQNQKRIKLCVQSLEGGPIKEIADSDRGFSNLSWTPDGKALAYVSNSHGRTNIWAQPLAGGSPRQITDFKSDWLMWFDWSPDGKQLFAVRGRLTSDLFEIKLK
jgi:Tol biopolymer transport system component